MIHEYLPIPNYSLNSQVANSPSKVSHGMGMDFWGLSIISGDGSPPPRQVGGVKGLQTWLDQPVLRSPLPRLWTGQWTQADNSPSALPRLAKQNKIL